MMLTGLVSWCGTIPTGASSVRVMQASRMTPLSSAPFAQLLSMRLHFVTPEGALIGGSLTCDMSCNPGGLRPCGVISESHSNLE